MTVREIKRLRKTLNLTQEALAARLGVNRVTLADWERGAHRPRGLYLRALLELQKKAKKAKG